MSTFLEKFRPPRHQFMPYATRFQVTDAQIHETSAGSSEFPVLAAAGEGKMHYVFGAIIRFRFYAKYTGIADNDAFFGFKGPYTISSCAGNLGSPGLFSSLFGVEIFSPPRDTGLILGNPFTQDFNPGTGVNIDILASENKPLTLEIYNGNGELLGGDPRNRISCILISTIFDIPEILP